MHVTAEVVAGVFGLLIGSFIGVVVDRVPRQESIVLPPSHCVACSAPIRAYDNIPIVSYALLRGRCRACGTRIPPRDAFLELGTGVLFVLLAWRLTSAWELPAYCVLAAAGVAISAIDIEHMRIPSVLVYTTVALGAPLLVLASAGTHRWSALESAAIGGAIALAAFGALFYAVPKGIGFGDVRLAGLCGGFLGWLGYREVVAGFVISFIVAGVPAALLLATGKVQRRTKIPFGPFLAAGTVITVLFAAPIVHAWSSI
jgi:leader peptidase (prepilin peptidase) / N-methyltransferase